MYYFPVFLEIVFKSIHENQSKVKNTYFQALLLRERKKLHSSPGQHSDKPPFSSTHEGRDQMQKLFEYAQGLYCTFF